MKPNTSASSELTAEPGLLIARRVRQLRYEKGWGPDDLAARAKISRTALYQIESGKTGQPRANTVRALARALGVEPSVLLDPSDNAQEPAAPSGSPEQVSADSAHEPLTVQTPASPPSHTDAPRWMRDLELECKFRMLLNSPMREAVARIVEQTYRLLPPESLAMNN